MMNNFAITGLGCSGTKFLAKIMKRDKRFTVKHEGNPSYDYMPIYHAQGRFKNFYGEVNSYLRFCFDDLRVGKKGVIYRNPMDIFWSNLEDKKKLSEEYYINIAHSLELLSSFRKNPKYIDIHFERMVTDIDYLNGILPKFGVDVQIEEIPGKVNQHRRGRYSSFEDLPKKPRDKFWSIAKEYINRYYYV